MNEEKKERILFYIIFISSLSWKWGENPHHPILWARGRIWMDSCIHLCYFSGILNPCGKKFHSNLTKDLQLKWRSLGSVRMGQRGAQEG
jgi:hypothetical protein